MRIVAHLDMDAFFASVEEKYTPAFRGKPLVVGSDPKGGYGRGVVSTANYKAREYGIHSAMPISRAWQASQLAKSQGKPEVIFTIPDFSIYETVSRAVHELVKKYSPLIEQASVDEFYFDLSHYKTFKKAEQICKKIKKEIKEQEKVTCSIGVGPNKLVSKIAAGMNKPDGLFIVRHNEAESFLEPMEIRKIPRVGPKTKELLNKDNIFLVKDLKKYTQEELKRKLGKWGMELYLKIRGIDDSLIMQDREVKSIGEQNTFEQDTFDIIFIGEEFAKYCARVFARFEKSGFSGFRTLAVAVRLSDFTTKTTAKSFPTEITRKDYKKFQTEALKLLLPYLDKRKNPRLRLIRLIGVRIERFSIPESKLPI
ncbi:MAG: DNA polymerase IV [bacterium]|nr:DNA polymerase IV [bacterium]